MCTAIVVKKCFYEMQSQSNIRIFFWKIGSNFCGRHQRATPERAYYAKLSLVLITAVFLKDIRVEKIELNLFAKKNEEFFHS